MDHLPSAAFPIEETIDTSDPGTTGGEPSATLATSATWYAEYGAIHTATDPSGLETSVVLDTLGRPVRMYGPGCAEPKAEIEYHLGSPLSHVATRTNESCDDESTTSVTAPYMEAFAWVDGMGRARGAVSEGSSTDELPGGDWIRSGIQTFDAKGAVQRAYLPNAVSSATAFSITPAPGTLYARSAYDAFGRVVRAWTTDGTAVVATRFGALVTDIWDAGDLSSGIYSATPTTTFVDGLGRTVRTVERNRSPGSAGIETFATDLQYNSLGAVVRMERGLVGGAERESEFEDDESVVKLQDYDTLGRRIVNHDPDAGDYRYSYDAIDRLVSTMDAREIINRYWYDRGGRLVAEDLGGEVEYSADGWDLASGGDAFTCPLDDHNLPVLPLPENGCFDILYGFDGEVPDWAEDWADDLPTDEVTCGTTVYSPQGPLAGRPSWTRDRSGTVALGYECHGWAEWSIRQVNPDLSRGYVSWSTFDEAQRLRTEKHPDESLFDFAYTTRGLLLTVDFTELIDEEPVERPLIRETRYDAQGRRVFVEYGDQLCTIGTPPEICEPGSEGCTCDETGTKEEYSYDARQRLSRKRALRADDLVVLDYRYTYDVASNIVRIDDDRLPSSEVEAPGIVEGFVPYDIVYEYDALNRLTKATPIYAEEQAHRVKEQTWSFDSLGSMVTWEDADNHFYGWSLGNILNGLQLTQQSLPDFGIGPLPRADGGTGCPMDALGRCVPAGNARTAPAPHALYVGMSGEGDALVSYYDAAGNMMAMTVHRPLACGREDEPGTSTPAAGGPDGAGCREGSDFRLMFAWDEVGNLLAVERQTRVGFETCEAPGGGWPLLPTEIFFGPGSRGDYEWCPTARVDNTYDFGGQRRLKYETNITDETGRIPELGSLYVSASYERREAEWNEVTEQFDDGLEARYLWNEAGILFELDDEVPEPAGVDAPKTRLTLTNQIGSSSTIVNADTGAESAILSQLPYGAEEQTYPRVAINADTAFAPRYEFTGKERDRGVGLVYFGARSLDPRLGRWTSVDPLVVQPSAGVGMRNAYRTFDSSPAMYVDPDGRQVFFQGLATEADPAARQAEAKAAFECWRRAWVDVHGTADASRIWASPVEGEEGRLQVHVDVESEGNMSADLIVLAGLAEGDWGVVELGHRQIDTGRSFMDSRSSGGVAAADPQTGDDTFALGSDCFWFGFDSESGTDVDRPRQAPAVVVEPVAETRAGVDALGELAATDATFGFIDEAAVAEQSPAQAVDTLQRSFWAHETQHLLDLVSFGRAAEAAGRAAAQSPDAPPTPAFWIVTPSAAGGALEAMSGNSGWFGEARADAAQEACLIDNAVSPDAAHDVVSQPGSQ